MASDFKAIRVKARVDFDWLMEHMIHESYRARDNWDFCVALDGALAEYWEELNQTPGFWELTRRAHQDALVLRLARLYDPHSGALSLGNLFQTIKENVSRAITVLPQAVASLNVTELDADIGSVSRQDPAVAKLLQIRNEYLAHRGVHHVTKGTFAALPTLDREDFSSLLEKAIELLTKYRSHLGYHFLAWGHHELEEFQRLLSNLRG